MSKEMTWEEYADELKAELAKVKKQLTIAVASLEKYADRTNWILGYSSCDVVFDIEKMNVNSSAEIAEKALRQIKELENA